MVDIEWWVYPVVLATLAILSLLLHVLVMAVAVDDSPAKRHGLATLFIGTDNRTSTSKLQAFLWTYGILWALASLLAGAGVDAFNVALGDQVRDEYLLLLGGPYAAAIGAKALTTQKLNKDPSAKDPKKGASTLSQRAAEVVVNDENAVDLGDFQYAAFTVLGLVYFAWAFMASPGEGLPEIPGTLLILMGISQAAYLTKKALP
jgi:hypothetical protein